MSSTTIGATLVPRPAHAGSEQGHGVQEKSPHIRLATPSTSPTPRPPEQTINARQADAINHTHLTNATPYQDTFNAVSSTTNEVCNDEFSVPVNRSVTGWPAYPARL
jgi:hypothetical protein